MNGSGPKEAGELGLDAWIHLRVSPSEKERFSTVAQEAGLTLSQLIRRVLRGEIPQPKVARIEFSELRRLGILLVGLAKNERGNPEQIQRLLDQIEALLGKLSQ